MWNYYLKLVWLSIKRTPVLSSLMVIAIATGIATCLTTFTLYSVIASNPMAHKNDSVFRLQLDSWGPDEPFHNANGVPINLTFRDAKAIYDSNQAAQIALTARAGLTLERIDSGVNPTVEASHLTTNGFFELFDVSFVYGGPWSGEADRNGERVAVISENMNNRYFNGANSVGEVVLLEGEAYTVVGVVSGQWSMIPNVYDLNGGGFLNPPQIYVPLFNLERRNFPFWGDISGWKFEKIQSHADFLSSELVWVQTWVSLVNEEQVQSFSQFIRNYISEQKEIGRFERPLRFEISTPAEWLQINKVVSRDNKMLVGLSLAFLLVCLVNAVVLLLAKFLRKAPEAGLRRALGATRGAIFVQHLMEAMAVGVAGGVVGLAFSWLGLAGIRMLYSSYQAVAVMNSVTVLSALALALASSVLSGILPAWQIARAQPSRYLKTQ